MQDAVPDDEVEIVGIFELVRIHHAEVVGVRGISGRLDLGGRVLHVDVADVDSRDETRPHGGA